MGAVKMKRNYLSVVLGIFVVTVMAACGKNTAQNTVSHGGAVSNVSVSGSVTEDTFVSGGVVSTDAINESSIQTGETKLESYGGTLGEIDHKTLRFANDRNIYEGDQDTKIYQYDLKGKEEYCYDMEKITGDYIYPEVLWVDNEWVFISCHIDQEYYEIWRIPVSKKNSKKRLLADKWEKLAEADRLDCLITKTDREIFYCADEKICRLDLKSKEKLELATGIGKWACSMARDSNGIPIVRDKKAYIQDGQKGEMYQLDLAKWEIRDIGAGPESNIGSDGTCFYYMTEEGLVKYNKKSDKVKTLFSREDLEDKIAGTKFPDTDAITAFAENMVDACVESVYCHQGRLYLAVKANCNGVEKDENDYYLDYEGDFVRFMYSCSASDYSGLRYEKGITEYLWKHSKPYHDSYEESMWAEETGKFLYLMDGGIVMRFYDEELIGKRNYENVELYEFVLYDLDSGTFQKIKRNSKEYGHLRGFGFTFYEEPHC